MPPGPSWTSAPPLAFSRITAAPLAVVTSPVITIAPFGPTVRSVSAPVWGMAAGAKVVSALPSAFKRLTAQPLPGPLGLRPITISPAALTASARTGLPGPE